MQVFAVFIHYEGSLRRPGRKAVFTWVSSVMVLLAQPTTNIVEQP